MSAAVNKPKAPPKAPISVYRSPELEDALANATNVSAALTAAVLRDRHVRELLTMAAKSPIDLPADLALAMLRRLYFDEET
jgi:hypothetical protein